MVKQFEDGKVYVMKGSKKPYEEIIEAGFYKSKNDAGQIEENLMLDFYTFDCVDSMTQARIYETGGSLQSSDLYSPEDFKEIGTVGIEYIADNTSLTEAKPSYKELEAALKKIARAKNSDFRNGHQVCNFMQKTAEEALKAGVLVAEGVK